MVGTVRCIRRNRRRLVALLFFLLAASGFAAESASIEFEPDRVLRGERFTLQIRTTIPWGDEVVISRPELIGPMVWWAYPYARPWTVEKEDGQPVRMVEVLAAVRVDAPGFHMVGPFQVASGDRTAITEPREIIGLEKDEGNFPYPVETGWRNIPALFWQGQAVPVILEARNLASLTLADDAILASAPAGLLEEAPSLGGIRTRPHGNDILYDVPMASWIWTIGVPGQQSFPGVKISVADLIRSTPSFSVEVRPLPEQVQTSAAVGHFSLSAEWDEGPYSVGRIVSVRIRVSGEGNLNVLKLPVPALEGASLVSQGSTSSYVPSLSGYQGWREDRFDFQIERTGELPLKIPGWTWLEPEGNGRVRTTGGESSVLSALESAGDSGQSLADRLLGAGIFQYPQAVFHWKNQYWLLLALPGFVAFLILFFIRRPGGKGLMTLLVIPLFLSVSGTAPREIETAARAAVLAREGNWGTARENYESLITDIGEFPGLLHDLAVTELEAGRADRAVAMIRRALHLRPGSAKLSETRAFIEGRLGLADQVPVPLSLSVSLIFAVWLAAVNLFFLSLALLMFRREAREVILFVSALIVLAATSFFTIYSDRKWRDTTAVVRVDSNPLRKIPGPLATDWIQLPAGSAVSVTAVEGEDYLVLTGYGLEGWLSRDSLIFVEDSADGF